MMFKQIVRAVAMRNGIHASFLPKPLPDQAGSGLHINLSLCMDGRNLFEATLPRTALQAALWRVFWPTAGS